MDLKSGYPYWAIKNGLMHAFPQLREDLRCDVVVIGAGITGALIADELASHGHDVVVLDQRDAAWGSTSASTALLQYEIDTHMVDLADAYGEENAVLAYRACADAIDLLADKAADVGNVAFSRMQSLYYASRKRHRKDLRREFRLRLRHGFDVKWLEAGDVRQAYGFDAPGAILRVGARGDREARDRRDRRQRLAAKAERAHALEVLERGDLACRVRQDRTRQVVGADAVTVVAHADQAHAAFLDVDLDAPRARVEAVLDQFLDHGCRALDHLAGGDLVDEFGGKLTDARHDAARMIARVDR